MEHKKHIKATTLGSQLTTAVSVTLVLLLLGLLGMGLCASRELGRQVRSQVGFIVKMAPAADPAQHDAVRAALEESPAVAWYHYADADTIMAREGALLGEDIGELLGQNPFGAEFDIRVVSDYAHNDSIAALTATLGMIDGVDEVITQAAVIDSINRVVHRASIVLLCVAIALLVISFVLISNTVGLAVYARRFIIHTMKLVGATPAFIRRPFLVAGAATGALSAAVAIGLLAALRAYGDSLDPMVGQLLPWQAMAVIYALTALAGITICVLGAAAATNRYLRARYDDMYK